MNWNNSLSIGACVYNFQLNKSTNNGTTISNTSHYTMTPIIFSLILAPLIIGFAVWKWNSLWEKARKRAKEGLDRIQSSIRNFIRKWHTVVPYALPPNTRRTQVVLSAFALTMLTLRVLALISPLSQKWIMDALISDQPATCYKFILFSCGLRFLQTAILDKVEGLLWDDIKRGTTEKIHTDVFRHVHRLPLKWHLERSTGEIHSMIQRGVCCISLTFTNMFRTMIPEFMDIFVAVVYCLVYFNLSVTIFVSLAFVIYLAVTMSLQSYRGKFGKEESELCDKFNEISLDSLVNFETVKHYGAEKLEESRFLDAYRKYKNAEFKDDMFWKVIDFTQETVIKLSTLIGSLTAAYLVAQPEYDYTVGDYVLFTTYVMELWWPLNALAYTIRNMSKNLEKMEKVVQLLNTEAEIRDTPNAVELEPQAGSIEFHDVSFSYKPDKPILRNVSFRIEPGQTVAIVGPSGSGKTTITRLLFRLYDATSGKITVNGHDMDKIKMESLRKRIGIVPQDCILFNQTVGFNIEYGKPGADNFDDVVGAAKAAAIHDFIASQKEGYETLVGERGLKLSGGEKQRIAIARATLKQPHYVVLDEATSALDTKTEREIQANLLALCHKKTCVIIAHRLSTVVHAHKIIVMNKEGRVAEEGSHEELLSKNGLYAEMWRIQLQSHIVESSSKESSNGETSTEE